MFFLLKTWWSARDYCLSKGLELISLETEFEVRYIRQKLLERNDAARDFTYWVGLNDNDNDGKKMEI